ncbi:MAG: hypothetical protein ACK5AV_07315, partial [Alphaproteobacteria bacterium]
MKKINKITTNELKSDMCHLCVCEDGIDTSIAACSFRGIFSSTWPCIEITALIPLFATRIRGIPYS